MTRPPSDETAAPALAPVRYRTGRLWFCRTCRTPSLCFSLCRGNFELSDRVIDAVEALAEPAQDFTPGRFDCGGEIVDTDFDARLRANQRYHFAVARGRRIRQIGHVDRQQIH